MNIYKKLKESRDILTPQQYRTIKGQAIAGDVQGAQKGLYKLLRKQKKEVGTDG